MINIDKLTFQMSLQRIKLWVLQNFLLNNRSFSDLLYKSFFSYANQTKRKKNQVIIQLDKVFKNVSSNKSKVCYTSGFFI